MKFVGPPLEEGPLPALIYLALSDEESLHLDPFNQPVKYLKSSRIRIFSLTIPGHGPDLDPTKAITFWRQKFDEGIDILTPFFNQAAQQIKDWQHHMSSIAIGGLSRGAFCACHIAALLPQVKIVLGFAPLIQLELAKEMQGCHLPNLALDPDTLCDRTIRFYIGNRDLRTGTENCFQFVRDLANAAFQRKIRSSPIELIVGPSIGHQGHGTAPHVFEAGANWLMEKLHEI